MELIFAVALMPPLFLGQQSNGDVRELTWVGFQAFQDVSRVYVRTTDPVRHRVKTQGDGIVVLVLENTRIPLTNNQRPLDTRYFDSPINLVVARNIEDTSPSVEIEIHLRRAAPFRETREDTLLALDFRR